MGPGSWASGGRLVFACLSGAEELSGRAGGELSDWLGNKCQG